MLTNKGKTEKTILIIFFILLALDASKLFFAPPPAPVQQQDSENVQNDDQNQQNFENKSENTDQGFDEEEADSNFQDFKENEYDEEKEQQRQQRRGQRNSNQKKSGSYSDPNQVLIQYCTNSPYKQEAKWLELTKALQKEIQFIDVQGVEYPAPQYKVILGKLCSYLQYIMLAFSLFGDKIFGFLQMPYPKWYLLFKEKKMIFIGLGFFAGSFGSNYFLTTNAFEVTINDQFVYSNLGVNGQPDIYQIVQLISESKFLK